MVPDRRQIVRACRIAVCGVLVGWLVPAEYAVECSHAAEWMFRRSYFSHTPTCAGDVEYPQPHSRSAYRRAWFGDSPGFAVRGGYRIKRFQLRSGDSIDTTVILEDRFEFRP